MPSLYDELCAKIAQSAGHTARNAVRRDLGLLLNANGEAFRDLWLAADACAKLPGAEASEALRKAVDRLRPLFGEMR